MIAAIIIGSICAIGIDALGHLHVKDSLVNIPHATVDSVPLNQGAMQPHLSRIAEALRRDGYSGAISLESIYRPPGGTFEDGFRASVGTFKSLFG